jgi:hypothetical protein
MDDNTTTATEAPPRKGGRGPAKGAVYTPKIARADLKAIQKTLVAAAKEGDVQSAALLMARPAQKERFVKFALPPIKSPEDVKLAQAAILTEISTGALTISEGEKLSKLCERLGSALAEAEFSSHLAKIEKRKGA